MSNDYFKAQGWFKNYARSSEDSRGMFQRLVEQDEKEFKLASAETDKIKAMINKKYGPGTIKYGSEIPQPPPRDDVLTIEAINRFMKASPMAEGGQMVKPSADGSRPGYAGSPAKGVVARGEYAGQPFARHRGDELPRGSIRISPDRIVFTGEDAQKNIDRFFNNRLSDKKFKKLRNQNKNLSNKEFLELIKKDYVNARGGEWKELAVDQKTSALTNIKKTEIVQPLDDPQRLKDIKKYFKDYKKQNNKFPTVQEGEDYFRSKLGKDIRPSIVLAAKEANIDLPSGYIGQKLKVDRDIEKLLNRKTITDTLDAGKFPTESQIQAVLKSTRTKASTRQVDLANYLTGNVKPEVKTNITIPTKYKNIATTAINDLELIKEGQFGPRKTRTRTYNEKRLAKILGIDSFQILRQDILNKIYNVIPELKGVLSVDEIGGITAGARTDSPYTIFGQVLGKDFNKYVKSTEIDKSKSLLEKKLITLAKDDPKRLVELEKYNQKVDTFEQKANKNNPAKKVKGMKLSFEPPSKTVKNKKVYNQFQDLFDAHYEKYGYSFEIDKDTDSLTDILKKLDNKSFQNEIKSNFKSLVDRPGPRGGKVAIAVALATLAGTGFALADDQGQMLQGSPAQINPVDEGFTDTERLLAGTTAGAAYAARKPILKTLAKVARPLGFPSVAAGFSLSNILDYEKPEDASILDRLNPMNYEIQDDPNLKMAGVDLLLPEIVKSAAPRGSGILSTLSRVAANPFGRAARLFTPVGAGITAIGLAKDYYDFVQSELARKAADPEAYAVEQEEQMGISA